MRSQRIKKSWVVYFVLAAVTLVLHIFAWNSETFCNAYIRYVFPIWPNTYGRLMSLFPFSVGEILLCLGVSVVVIMALVALVTGIRAFKGLFLRKGREAGQSRWPKFARGYCIFFAWTVLIVWIVMTFNCTLLYHASTFSEQYFPGARTEFTLEELIAVRNLVVERCNALSEEMPRDGQGNILWEEDIHQLCIDAMKSLGQTYDQLDGYYPRPKPLAASDFFCQQYIQGYYFPFSMEANYNDVMCIMNLPATICHEYAHLRGYIYEDEANFVGFLACIQSDNIFLEYSGYLSVLNYLDNDFYASIGRDRETYLEQVQILPQVHVDNTFVTDEDWERINGKALIDTETVDQVSDVLSDISMKANGIEDGILSYTRVVELLLQYYVE